MTGSGADIRHLRKFIVSFMCMIGLTLLSCQIEWSKYVCNMYGIVLIIRYWPLLTDATK
jgi:heme/copper-type cytochrome/quinol oxidase subunit 4